MLKKDTYLFQNMQMPFQTAWKMKGLPNVGWQQNATNDARGRNEIPVHLMVIIDCLLQCK